MIEFSKKDFFGKPAPHSFVRAWLLPELLSGALKFCTGGGAERHVLPEYQWRGVDGTFWGELLYGDSRDGPGILAGCRIGPEGVTPESLVPVFSGETLSCDVRAVRRGPNGYDGDVFLQPVGSWQPFSVAIPGLAAFEDEAKGPGLRRFTLWGAAVNVMRLGESEKIASLVHAKSVLMQGDPGVESFLTSGVAYAAPADFRARGLDPRKGGDDSSLYEFRSEAGPVETFEFLGETILRTRITIVRTLPEGIDVSIPLYIRSKDFGDDPLREGDLIAGLFWLTGRFVTSKELVPLDSEKQDFLRCYEAARSGDPRAMTELAEGYFQGRWAEPDNDEGLRWLLRAADLEWPEALARAGLLYETGAAGKKDPEAALRFYRRGAELGSAAAQTWLSVMLSKNPESKEAWDEAEKWLEKAVRQKFPPALFAEAIRHLEGSRWEKPDRAAAFSTAKQYREIGDPRGVFALAASFLRAPESCPDPGTAVKWVEYAAESGVNDANWLLAQLYREGRCVKRSPTKASTMIAIWGARGTPHNRYLAGLAIIGEKGFRHAPESGFSFVRSAAEENDPGAQAFLGEKLVFGDDGIGHNPREGVKWLRRAAKAENPVAFRILGKCALLGIGLKKDPETAFRWLRKGAQLGDHECLVEGGIALIHGTGTMKNVAEGVLWIADGLGEETPLAEGALTARIALVEADGTVPEAVPNLLRYLRGAIERGSVHAMKTLVEAYEGGLWGVVRNLREAKRLLEGKAAEGSVTASRLLAGFLRRHPELAGRRRGKRLPQP